MKNLIFLKFALLALLSFTSKFLNSMESDANNINNIISDLRSASYENDKATTAVLFEQFFAESSKLNPIEQIECYINLIAKGDFSTDDVNILCKKIVDAYALISAKEQAKILPKIQDLVDHLILSNNTETFPFLTVIFADDQTSEYCTIINDIIGENLKAKHENNQRYQDEGEESDTESDTEKEKRCERIIRIFTKAYLKQAFANIKKGSLCDQAKWFVARNERAQELDCSCLPEELQHGLKALNRRIEYNLELLESIN